MATFNVTKIVDAIIGDLRGRQGIGDAIDAIEQDVLEELRTELKAVVRANVEGCLANCQDDEPIFVLVARDQTAPETVDDWIDRAAARGVASEKLADAKALASQMDDWQERHGSKVPD